MNRRKFLTQATGGIAAVTAAPELLEAKPRAPFAMRGVYFHDGFDFDAPHAPLRWNFDQWKRQIRWLKECGINAVEFATMLEFNRIPTTAMERQKIADRLKLLDYVHSLDMKFGYLLTNTVLSTVPPDEEPSHQLKNRAETLCPRIGNNFEKTLANPLFYMQTYKEADFFEEFAADWGGCTCGQCGVPEFLRYVRVLGDKLKTLNPKAELYADTWCISYWGKDPLPNGWKFMFDKEISGSREVIAALPNLPQNVGVGLPCHHHYRPLAFTEYGGKAKTPLFPVKSDVQQIHAAKRSVMAWTHFVMDDDAFRPKSWGIVHSEVRYIAQLLQSLQTVGIDSVMGNLYLPFLQLSNAYAWGRLTHNPNEKPETILRDFARIVAHKDDAAKLADVLKWLENGSYWERQMPPDGRLPHLPCTLNRTQAAELAATVRPNAKPSLPLPITPELWLKELKRSIEKMDWT
jgi:hypothetical protein